jgi:hypothetical protein
MTAFWLRPGSSARSTAAVGLSSLMWSMSDNGCSIHVLMDDEQLAVRVERRACGPRRSSLRGDA